MTLATSTDEARRAFEAGAAELQASVRIRVTIHEADEHGELHEVTKILDTTVGRALFSGILPKGMELHTYQPGHDQESDFERSLMPAIARWASRRPSSSRISSCTRASATRRSLVFRSASTTWLCPKAKKRFLQVAEAEVKEIQDQYGSGLVTDGERYNKVVDIWSRTNDQVAKAMMDKLGTETVKDASGKMVEQESFNSILHDGRLRRSWFGSADSSARWYAWPDGEAGWLDH